MTGASFSQVDVGKIITIQSLLDGANDLKTTIRAVTSTTLVLEDTAGVSETDRSVYVIYGNDDAPSFQRMSQALVGSGGTIIVSPGSYLMNEVTLLPSNTTVTCLPGAQFYMTDGQRNRERHWIFANEGFAATSLTNRGITISGCTFNGATTTPSTGANAIRYSFASEVRAARNTFYNFGDAVANVGSNKSVIEGNRAYNITNTCWDHWWAPTSMKILNNYCETRKHGTQVTGTDTAQTGSGKAQDLLLQGNEYRLLTAEGSAVWLNSGAKLDNGAGVAHAKIVGENIYTSGLGSQVGTCLKASGSGTSDVWFVDIRCNNAIVVVNPVDVVTSRPRDIHLQNVFVVIANPFGGAAIQIHAANSDIESSTVKGGGYTYAIESDQEPVHRGTSNRLEPGRLGQERIGAAAHLKN